MVRAACYRAGMRHSLRAAGDPVLRVVRALPAPLGSHYRWQGSALAGPCTRKSWGQDVSRDEAACIPLSRAPRPVTRASRGAGAALAEQSSLPRRPLHSPAESARTARARRAGGSARAGRAAVRSGSPGAQVAEGLRCPDQSTLITLATAQPGAGCADWVDVLLVAADGLVAAKAARPALARSPARWLLVSDLRARVSKVENLGEILEAIGAKLRELEARPGRPRPVRRAQEPPRAESLLKSTCIVTCARAVLAKSCYSRTTFTRDLHCAH